MKTTKASNYLTHTRYEFTDYHIKTANNINTSNAEGKLRGLGHLTNSFHQKLNVNLCMNLLWQIRIWMVKVRPFYNFWI